MTTNDKITAELNKFVNSSANKYCAECNARQPRWASANLGVLICLRCSGIHRSLGVHISKVKSVNLDAWTYDQVQHMISLGGNTAVNKIYEYSIPSNRSKPTEESSVYTTEQYIRDKYERKLFCKRVSLSKTSPKQKQIVAETTESDEYETASDDEEPKQNNAKPSTNGHSRQQSRVVITPPKKNTANKRHTNKSQNTAAVNKQQNQHKADDLLPDLSKLDLFANDNNSVVPVQANASHANNAQNDSGFAFFNDGTNHATPQQQITNGIDTTQQPQQQQPKRDTTKSILDLFDTAPTQSMTQQQPFAAQQPMPLYNQYQQPPAQPQHMYVPPQQYMPGYGQQISPRAMSQQSYNGYMQPQPMYGMPMQQQPMMQQPYAQMPMQSQYPQQMPQYAQSQYPQQPLQSSNDIFSIPAAPQAQKQTTHQSAPVKDAFSDLAGLSFGQKITQSTPAVKQNGSTTNSKPLPSQQFSANDFSFL